MQAILAINLLRLAAEARVKFGAGLRGLAARRPCLIGSRLWL